MASMGVRGNPQRTRLHELPEETCLPPASTMTGLNTKHRCFPIRSLESNREELSVARVQPSFTQEHASLAKKTPPKPSNVPVLFALTCFCRSTTCLLFRKLHKNILRMVPATY